MPAILDFVDPAQKGFLSGRQGSDHIVDVNSFFYQGIALDDERFLFLLDTAKAFDSLDHRWIFFVLEKLSFPKWFTFFVRACLQNVCVSPFFGKDTGVWIDIERGVKQGCPLSPLLFVICYDPLLFLLRQQKDISFYAFADDLCLTSLSLPALFPALSTIDSFSDVSGLGVNKSKSFVLPTSEPSRFSSYKDLLLYSPWPDLDVRERGTHLGIVIGRKVTLSDIWDVPLQRALTRIRTSYSFVRTLSLSKRILYVNVFIVSIFSYVGLFFILPTGIWRKIKYAISKLIVPLGGSGCTYESLVCADIIYNIKPALKDVWAFNISLLASRSPFISSSFRYHDLPRVNVRFSKLINLHRDAAAVDFWRSRHLEDGTLLPLPKCSSSSIYKVITRDVFLDKVLDHNSDKICRLLSSSASLPSSVSPLDILYSISDNLLLSSAPPYLCMHQFMILQNALPTSRRLRHISSTSISNVNKCNFCGLGEDSIIHIYTSCVVVNRARVSFFSSLSLDMSCFRPPDSFLSSPSVPPFFRRPHLFPSLVNYISSLLPTSPPSPSLFGLYVIGNVSLAPTLLCGVPLNLVIPILAFNFAVWQYRRPALAARSSQDASWLSARVHDVAINVYKSASSQKKPASSVKNTNAYSNARLIHDSICSRANANVVFCYVDGSASPNPGPCGAGASIFFNDPDVIVDAGRHLGHGTNNIGELCALLFCLCELILAFASRHFEVVHIFCDSNYAIQQASSTRKPKANRDIITNVRAVLLKARALFRVDLHWVKGHARVGGNNRADQLSKFFANHAKATPFDSSLPINYLTCSSAWKFSFPLNNVPFDCFDCSSSLRSALWRSKDFSDLESSNAVLRSLYEPLDFKHSD